LITPTTGSARRSPGRGAAVLLGGGQAADDPCAEERVPAGGRQVEVAGAAGLPRPAAQLRLEPGPAGIDQRVSDDLLGHTTEAMRKRYRHSFPDQRREAVLGDDPVNGPKTSSEG